MLFPTLSFAVFFAALLALYVNVPQTARAPLLLAASLLFYALWVPAYLALLLVDIAVNYLLLRAIVSGARPRVTLVVSIAFTLGLLAFFKYAGFLVELVSPFAAGMGLSGAVPEIVLPLGISFYSFQILGLAIDCYRTRPERVPSLSDYALFVSFFPQLVAGPILRGGELLPQIAAGGERTSERSRRGVWLVAAGVVKKVVLADFLLAPFVDEVFAEPGVGSAPFHLLALYSFAFQIYFDFSGYTDMARGLALLIGYELPLNFREPYLSRNPAEFWRRWHITLSRWLRDYLYIPLGGNRGRPLRTRLNLFVTMLLGGLWHGAGWNFVLWGGLHGLLLVAHRLLPRRPESASLAWRDLPSILLCSHAVFVLWVFFRTASFPEAQRFLAAIARPDLFDTVEWPLLQTLVVATCAALHPLERWLRLRLPHVQRACASSWWAPHLEGIGIGLVMAAAIATSGTGGEFIYFQF